MKISMLCLVIALLLSHPYVSVNTALGQNASYKLLGDFLDTWTDNWIARRADDKPAKYQVVQEDTNLVLQISSHNSVSVLWRMLNLKSTKVGKISWRWKIEKSLSKKNEEKTKIGDDYAARLFVVFEPHLVSWKTRALCYVWAAKEPVGSVYRNPYAKSVGTIVVESGNKQKRKWITEERNFISDYVKIFRDTPEMISAVAIMVDTDNTGQKATAWFDDIVLQLGEEEVKSSN